MSPALHDGPILRTLLKLAAPNVLAMLSTVAMGMGEVYFVSRLGTAPLAALALVFPFAMLTQMLSAGAMGGGVSSAVARALGAGDVTRANALAMHALVIGGGVGVVHSLVFIAIGPPLYRLLGGSGPVLTEAMRYSLVLFCGAWLVWLSNTLASILRGSGNMRVPSVGIVATAIVQLALGGALALGVGPIAPMGMAGVALGHIVATTLAVAFFGWQLTRGGLRLQLRWHGLVLRREMFADILKVGALACLSPLQSVLAAVIFTGFVARLGVPALAGYGIGQRLEFLLVPIAFGIGVASVPMVGMAIGAGKPERARRVAWTAGAASAFNLALIGFTVALAPDWWAALFSTEAAVLEHARQYLRIAGPAFPLFGLGLTLYFASQGSGRVLGPVLAGTVRLAIVVAGGAWLLAGTPQAAGLFAVSAVAMAAYGIATAAAVKFTSWSRQEAARSGAARSEVERKAPHSRTVGGSQRGSML